MVGGYYPPFLLWKEFFMYNIVCQYLIEIEKVLIPLIFLRIVLDSIRNYIFKN